ncbi:16S rRNA (guanine(966)-N(2))-methyltransferase RsmD [Pontibacillus sp. ALD_SL1]|uniref:16S rRNA (guanine(966)-N(2))-methyltransferase RsmD n=1 Tax=Pontibacillus sp. ALD_SL1 TaxID=2777185 RepID=UPI001A965858|nr:16S rRNA (guanine(966)-N(2))-methyltransferase RsmD [Pontibacillus sp. ALD_SL1]QST01474.1 16S rRNA (guanine(966)-N(2))-methyltransferase RsmD [Pontibacillus sp. ALD_SL1]
MVGLCTKWLEKGVDFMRVIAGEHKGRQLQPVPHRLTRPTTDKVKEALFQMIGPYFDGGVCLDLFAGSGGLGIESLSRGMDKSIFVDKHPKAVATIYDNLKTLKLEDHAEVYKNDAYRAIKAAGKRGLRFDLVFLDPPYDKFSYQELIDSMLEHSVVHEGTTIVCEHSSEQSLPDSLGPFKRFRHETYSSIISISLYKQE